MLLPPARRLARPAAALPSPRVGSCLLLRRLLFFSFPLAAVTLRVSAPEWCRATCVAHTNATSAGRGPGGGARPGRGPLPRCARTGNLERGLGKKRVLAKPLRMAALLGERAVCSPHPRPVLGPAGFAPALSPSPEGSAAAAPHRRRWRGGRRGLQISASAWIAARSRQRAPEVSGGFVHQFSQLKCGAAIGGGPAGISPALSLAPPPGPFHPGEGRGRRRLLGRVPTDRALRENVTAENS